MLALRRNVRLLAITNFFTDFSLLAPVYILFLQARTGSLAIGMAIIATSAIAAAAGEVPTGVFSDFLGRRRTKILGSGVSFLAWCLIASAYSIPILFLGAIVDGIARSFFSGNDEALLHDTLKAQGLANEYADFLGKTRALFQVALAVSAVAGSVLAATWSFALVAWLSVLPKLINFVLSFWFIEPPHSSQAETNTFAHLGKAIKLLIKHPELRPLTIANSLGFAFGEASYQFRSAFVNTVWPLWAVGIGNFLANVGAAASYYWSGAIFKLIAPAKFLLFTQLYSKVIHFLALLWPSRLSPILMSSTSVFWGASNVAKSTTEQKHFSDAERATLSSLTSLIGSLTFGLASLLVGMLGDAVGPRWGLLTLHLLSLSSTFFYYQLWRANNHARA